MEYITKKVYLLRGLPASGKSTWAREWVSQDPENRVILSKDAIREMFGKYWVPSREGMVRCMFRSLLISVLVYRKYDIVLDTTGFNESFVKDVKFYVNLHNQEEDKQKNQYKYYSPTYYDCEFLDFFSTSLEECIRRDKLRERSVGEDVIRGFYEKYKSIINP